MYTDTVRRREYVPHGQSRMDPPLAACKYFYIVQIMNVYLSRVIHTSAVHGQCYYIAWWRKDGFGTQFFSEEQTFLFGRTLGLLLGFRDDDDDKEEGPPEGCQNNRNACTHTCLKNSGKLVSHALPHTDF